MNFIVKIKEIKQNNIPKIQCKFESYIFCFEGLLLLLEHEI